jgi:poly(A) polymerase
MSGGDGHRSRPRDERPLRDKAKAVVARLRDAGHEAFWAGGCVRDLLRRVEPKDYDIATSAEPDAVIALFPRTIPVGKDFGVVQVRYGGEGFEVATFRADVGYSDGRRPDGVRFCSAEEDVKRRDFTMNGLLMDPLSDQIIDYVGGRDDLERRVVRAIGEPAARFAEDKLRMLRAVRFATVFGFDIDAHTFAAIRQHAPDIRAVSAERIRTELLRMLGEGSPRRAVELLSASDLLSALFADHALALAPEPPTSGALEWIGPGDAVLAMAVWMHRLSPGTAAELGQALRLSRKETARISAVLAGLAALPGVPALDVASRKRFLRQPDIESILAAWEALSAAEAGDAELALHCRELLATYSTDELWPPRLLDGNGLQKLGYRAGPGFKDALEALEDAQLRGDVGDVEGAQRLVAGVLGPPPQGARGLGGHASEPGPDKTTSS